MHTNKNHIDVTPIAGPNTPCQPINPFRSNGCLNELINAQVFGAVGGVVVDDDVVVVDAVGSRRVSTFLHYSSYDYCYNNYYPLTNHSSSM